jgi:hypothetical protein
MSIVIEHLKLFNSKERFFLIGQVLGNKNLIPSLEFRATVAAKLGLHFPDELFTAMDYHLDWLYASLYLAFKNKQPSHIYDNPDRLIRGQQEDIDFLFAYDVEDVCHIILMEAKGVGNFTNKQMISKAARFSNIFGTDGNRWPGVVPHFVLISPTKPSQRLRNSDWPTWMLSGNSIPWIPLQIPSELRKITLCNQQGKSDKNGQYWTLVARKYKIDN